jgi:ABC-type branched-subunit amino acid transport system ATPase component
MEMVFNFADRIMVMQLGTSIVQGLPEDVRRNPRVRDAYLGGHA